MKLEEKRAERRSTRTFKRILVIFLSFFFLSLERNHAFSLSLSLFGWKKYCKYKKSILRILASLLPVVFLFFFLSRSDGLVVDESEIKSREILLWSGLDRVCTFFHPRRGGGGRGRLEIVCKIVRSFLLSFD